MDPCKLLLAAAAAACCAGLAFGADIYVSPRGSDEAPGTRSRPFATIRRARDAVRELVAAGLTNDVRVQIREGTYMVPEGIVFGPEDSGTAAHSVTYAAPPGETVRLTGGLALTDWRPHRGSIQVADIPAGVRADEPDQLFEDGRRMTLARVPNEGYLRLVDVLESRTKFTYRAGDLDPAGWDVQGARVFIWPGHDWFSQDKPVASVDAATRTIALATRDGYDMRKGNRYYVHNILEALDRPGECRIDLRGRRLYAWPKKAPISRREMAVAAAEHVIAVEGEPGRPVRNLHFEGLDVGVSTGHAMLFKACEDCSVRFCLVENGGANGIHVEGHAQRVTIYGNEIREHVRHGIELAGLGPGKPDVNHGHTLENNHIHHCGRLVGHGYGVRVSQSGRNRIVHNHIHHMPRYGTTIKGLRYQSLRQSVKGVTFENRHDFLHSRENLIAYNHIHHVNLDSQDTGAMESWGPGRDNVYDHNLIHDTGNTQLTLQSGMYLDDATDYFTLTNNIIYGVAGAGGDQCIFAKGIGNRIENNILIVGPTNVSAIRSLFMADERCDHHTYLRNIIVFEGEAARPGGAFDHAVGNIHDRGMTIVWKVNIPASGKYRIWMRYGAHNEPFGRTNMGGQTTLAAGVEGEEGEPVTLRNLPDTGGWSTYEWKLTGEIEPRGGPNTLTWVNVEGGGINIDAMALSDDPRWKPKGVDLRPPARGRHLVVIQAETFVSKGGEARPGDRRAIYDFNNWSDDRVAEADWNLFWKPAGEPTVKGGPANGSFEKWLALEKPGGGGYDRNSVVADPEFRDLEGRDFRLRRTSPALRLGFKPIDTGRIGLKPDFPRRLARK